MPIKALSLGSRWWFVPEGQDDDPTPTKFELESLDSRVMGLLRDMLTDYSVGGGDGSSIRLASNSVAFKTVQFATKGWANFQDADGNDVEFKTVRETLGGVSYNVVDPSVLRRVPLGVIQEIHAEVQANNRLGPDEAGNSEGE